MKQCCRCKEWRSVEDFGRAKNRSDGLYPQCKECVRESARLWRERNPEKRKEQKRREREKHAEQYKEYKRAHYLNNKERYNQKSREWYEANREKVAEYGRAYYAANKDAVKARFRSWLLRNAEHHREQKREYFQRIYPLRKSQYVERGKRWRRNNHEAMMAAVHRRRARLAAAPGSYTAAEWNDLCDRYGNKCLRCGCAGPLTKDHIVPLSRGGSNDISNLQPLCSTCNKSKGAKSVDYRPQV